MMRSHAIALTLVLLSLVATGPAFAQMTDECPHTPTVASLRECVQHAAGAGFIDNAGVAQSLLAQLDAAQAAVDRGQPAVAANILVAFIQELSAQAGQHIAAEHAVHLQLHAQHVIEALGG
ncbi:MAG TPA: hypothetical protein DEP84_03800 [Chloroflexi bacterium]|nr:hypothetical protein [Chloroflexota bacterium]